MSEFKFACPVCGQHITADASISGQPLECPTCFQKLIVPQAPASGQSKLILSATQAGKRPPGSHDADANLGRWRRAPAKTSLAFVGLLLLLLGLCGVVWHFWGEKALHRIYVPRGAAAGLSNTLASPSPATPHPVPTDVVWTLDVTNARMPQATVAGRIHGAGFVCERATLHGGTLSLRQGSGWPPELGITIFLNTAPGEDLSRRTIVIPVTAPSPGPRITLRWRDEKQAPVTAHIHGGYALKILFGPAANGRIPGRLYVGLNDEARSFAAGNFDAEIRPGWKVPSASKPRTLDSQKPKHSP